jgi:hypothetical protein
MLRQKRSIVLRPFLSLRCGKRCSGRIGTRNVELLLRRGTLSVGRGLRIFLLRCRNVTGSLRRLLRGIVRSFGGGNRAGL